nr:MAG TPA: hypothetical protein [Caudoviricetes sp.]DAS83763.1 MAG TPA: hypothetical protein [Caudoviricetes sp.]
MSFLVHFLKLIIVNLDKLDHLSFLLSVMTLNYGIYAP